MKILYVATVSGTINAFLIPHIRMLIESGHQVDVACRTTTPIDKKLLGYGCKIHELPFQRSPLKRENYLAYKKLKKVINQEKYEIIHTHTPIASACVRFACRKLENVKVIYTAHGFHFYKGASFKNWIMYYPIERYLAKYTDMLITINQEDYERAKNFFKIGRVEYIPGVGLDTERFGSLSIDKVAKRNEIGVPKDAGVILSVGEINGNKNHEIILRAIEKLKNPNIHYLVCGKGPLEEYLKKISIELGIEKQVHLLGFRSDIAEICKVADIFAFPSNREGLSVAIMESMACGLPIVCSEIRGNSDLVENEKGGYLVKQNNLNEYVKRISILINDPIKREEYGTFNKSKVLDYSTKNVLKKLNDTYLKIAK